MSEISRRCCGARKRRGGFSSVIGPAHRSRYVPRARVSLDVVGGESGGNLSGRAYALSVRRGSPGLPLGSRKLASCWGQVRGGGGVLPADSAAADLGVVDARVERHRLGQGSKRGGLRVDSGVVAKRRGKLARTCQFGRMSPGREALGRTRWRRPSGWVTVPSFSAWVSSGKTTSALAVVAFRAWRRRRRGRRRRGRSSRPRVSGKSRRGSTPKRIRELSSPDSSAARISSRRSFPPRSRRGRGRRRGGSRPRAGRGRW